MNITRELREAASSFIKITEIEEFVEMKCGLETSWGQAYLLRSGGSFLCLTKSSFSTPWEKVELDSQITPWIEESDFEQFLVITGNMGNLYRVKLYALEKDALDNFLKTFENTAEHRHINSTVREDDLRVLSDFERQVHGIEKGSKPVEGIGFIDPVYPVHGKTTLKNDDRQGAVRGTLLNNEQDELDKIARKVESKVIDTVRKFTSDSDGSQINPENEDIQNINEADLTWHGKSQVESLRTLAELSISKGEFEKALNYLNDIFAKLPHDRDTIKAIIGVYEKSGNYQAMSAFLKEKACSLPLGQNRDFYCDQGVILARTKLSDEDLASEFLKLKDNV